MIEHWQLKQRQSLPLESKILFTQARIREFYTKTNGHVYVSFSGGKDSTVLLNIVRSLFPSVPAVFVDTGLEWPEIREFVKTIDNVIWLKPKMPFNQVIEKYGYPVVSKEIAQKIHEINTTQSSKLKAKRLSGLNGNGKLSEKWKFLLNAPFKISHQCCNKLKKEPIKKFEKESGLNPIIGTMASESRLRESNYLRHGCNSFDGKRITSQPLSIWLESDIYEYIEKYSLPISEIYHKGAKRTGCIFCMFGAQFADDNRFELLKELHPQLYKYCMEKLGIEFVMEYIKNRGMKEKQLTLW